MNPIIPIKKPRFLRIDIPALNSALDDINKSEDTHSLFSATDTDSLFNDLEEDSIPPLLEETLSIDCNNIDDIVAIRTRPPIPGLFFDPSVVLPSRLADEVVSFCMRTYFLNPEDNQVMLFGRFLPLSGSSESSGFPPILLDLLETMSLILRSCLQPETYSLLFPAQPTRARQAIINLYQPGEGITPHVDLLGRYGDGIVGVSFSSGSVMRFDKVNPDQSKAKARWDVYLPARTVVVLSQEARYSWTHGIDKKRRDFVAESGSSDYSSGRWIERGTRLSVTFRWLLPGADVLGDGPS